MSPDQVDERWGLEPPEMILERLTEKRKVVQLELLVVIVCLVKQV